MQKQVYLRRENVNGDNDLVRVTVLSEKDGHMRVKIPGVFHPKDVEASATIPIRPAAQPVPSVPGSFARDLYR